jgi:CofD-related protein of GAK system
LFLSGGTALRGLSLALARYTHNSVHLITPFDSGGSSAPLRAAFDMPAVGDLRNRLLALAGDRGRPLRRVLQTRLPKDEPDTALRQRLAGLRAGRDPLLADLPERDRSVLCGHLARLEGRLPDGFDLRGASVGNLVLAGSYLEERDIDGALRELGELLEVRGRVLPTADVNLHLAARLADGTELVGQHAITGKEQPALRSRIEELFLVSLEPGRAPVRSIPPASPEAIREIERADLVCYPMGSFYSSVLCNALPRGIGHAIASASCPKVYVPSTGRDPELVDTDVGRAACLLVEALGRDAGDIPARKLLDRILLDENLDVYGDPPDTRALESRDIERTTAQLVTPSSLPDIDSDRLAQVLVSLAGQQAQQERDAPEETP